MSEIARTQAIASLNAELARREDIRCQRSQELFGHIGAVIPGTFMSERERWDFLLDAYDEALVRETASSGELPRG